MKNILNFLKGICIGVANIIPGFSGGTMAVMMNIYDLFVYAFANIFNDFINVIKKCWSLFLGIGVGIILALIVIVKLLEVIPFITIMFFVGLILGTIPQIYQKTKNGKLKIIDIVCFLIAIAILVILPLLKTSEVVIEFNVQLYIVLFILGIICSSSMVIPGVSGSLVLMAFGYYAFLMNVFKDFLQNVFAFSSSNYLNMVLVILSFGIGCIIGIVFISKLITKLTEKYPKTVYFTILGLLFASPFSIIYATLKDYVITFDIPTIIFSFISLILGVGLVFLAQNIQKKYEMKVGVENENNGN